LGFYPVNVDCPYISLYFVAHYRKAIPKEGFSLQAG
jgi:hypothetical protein